MKKFGAMLAKTLWASADLILGFALGVLIAIFILGRN